MTGERPSDVLGSLPHTRPHRRSRKRPARAVEQPRATVRTTVAPRATDRSGEAPRATAKTGEAKSPAVKPRETATVKSATARPASRPKSRPARLRQPAQPAGTPPGPRAKKPQPTEGSDVLATAVQAAAEIAEIGLSAGARAIRSAVSRLPRP